MGIRQINEIYNKDDNIEKVVKESKEMYENEKYAYTLLAQNVPSIISFDDENQTIIVKKINGKTLNEISINEDIIIKLANAIKKLHSYTKNDKTFVHGDLHKENVMYYNGEIYFIDFSCSRYDVPEADYSAIEIHIINDKNLLELFYKTIGVKPNIQILKKEKVKHCLKHLSWADREHFENINIKSKRIIEENDELINENDFDYLGLIKLTDNKKVENLVSLISENKYISRSKEYYKKKTYNELVIFRENLKKLFPLEIKKAFVVCEYMLNASYRIFYEDYQRAISNTENNINISQQCMEEDVKNIICCLENKVIDTPSSSLQYLDNDTYVENRLIEGDHKMLLYNSISNITDCSYVVCPLFSAVLIGPFFKMLHGIDYSYVKFGVHDQNMKKYYDEGKLNLRRKPKSRNNKQNPKNKESSCRWWN